MAAALVLAGCIADDDEADPGGPGGGTDDGEDTNGGSGNSGREDSVDEYDFEYSGSAELGIGTSATQSNFWMSASDEAHIHKTDFPTSFDNGSLRMSFDWSSVIGGLVLWVQDGDGETVHVFEVDENPYTVDLGASDDRVVGADQILVLPDQGFPATFHQHVEWELEFSFTRTTTMMWTAESTG